MSSDFIRTIISILITNGIVITAMIIIYKHIILNQLKKDLKEYKTELKKQVEQNLFVENARLEKVLDKYKSELKEQMDQNLIKENNRFGKVLDKEKAMLGLINELYSYNMKNAEELLTIIDKSHNIATLDILVNKRHFNEFESDLSVCVFNLENKLSYFQPYIPESLYNDINKFREKIQIFLKDYHNIEEHEKEYFSDEKRKDLKLEISELHNVAKKSIKDWIVGSKSFKNTHAET
ncbi:MAG: hypothetical protein HY934_00940 [Candidatus Firestonebacteria bacterium]|nr:hypothetical protein [Candidatus Firestonebacteria bacterium]